MKALLQFPLFLVSFLLLVNVVSVKNSSAQNFNNSQLVTKISEVQSGTPDTLDYGASTYDKMKHLIVTGNTKVGSTTDMLITKYTLTGAIDWEHTYNNANNSFDYGTAVATDDSDNIYIAGTSLTSLPAYFDFVIRKYDSSGAVKWTVTYNGPGSNYDIPTDIKFFNGAVYVTGTSVGSGTGADYCTIKYDRGGGSALWTSRYDYNSLTDIPATLTIASNGNIVVSGGSASTNTNWDFATVKYKATSGSQQSVVRSTSSGLGLDLPTAAAVDQDGNIYVCGYAAITSNGYDIKIVKLDTGLSILWADTLDGGAHLNDQANSIGVDANGNVYVTGYTTKLNGGSDYITIKYNSSGALQWQKRYSATDTTKFSQAKHLDIDPYGSILVTGTVFKFSHKEILTLAYDVSGNKLWEKWYEGNGNLNNYALTVRVDTNNTFYVMGRVWTGTAYTYATVKYKMIDYITPPDTESCPNIFAYYENKGQLVNTIDSLVPNVKFYSQHHYPDIYFKNDTQSFVFAHIDTSADDTLQRIDLTLKNSLPTKVYNTSSPVPGYLNYFLPWCPNGVTDVRGFQRLLYPEIYDHIDWMVYGNGAGIKYYFILKPGADPKDIILQFSGADTTKILVNGKLEIVSSIGSFTFESPFAFQIDTDGSVINLASPTYYTSGGANKIEFHTPSYNINLPMIIEVKKGPPPSPSGSGGDNIYWSTYFVTNQREECFDVKSVAPNKDIYVTGHNYLQAFPQFTSVNILSNNTTKLHIFIAKFHENADPWYITYFGGNDFDLDSKIAISSATNNTYTAFSTSSTNFIPVYSGSQYHQSFTTDAIGFIVELNEFGTSILWSTYLLGTFYVAEMDFNPGGGNVISHLYLVGEALDVGHSLTNYNLSGSYHHTDYGCGYILRFSDIGILEWGTRFGGNTSNADNYNPDESTLGIGFAPYNYVVITGYSKSFSSSTFPSGYYDAAFANAYVQGNNTSNGTDAYVASFDPDGKLLWATLFGGGHTEKGWGVTLDNNENIYIVGSEGCGSATTTTLPFDETYPFGTYYYDDICEQGDGFIAQFASSGERLWGSLLGGSAFESLSSVVYGNNNVFVGGRTGGSGLDVESFNSWHYDASYQTGGNANFISDGILAGFSEGGDKFYASYFGGDGHDLINAMYSDDQFLYLTGETEMVNVDIPLHDPSLTAYYQPTSLGTSTINCDGFITKLTLSGYPYGINEIGANNYVETVFPNPTNSWLYIHIANPEINPSLSFEVYDVLGKRQLNGNLSNYSIPKVNVSNLSNGVYLLKIIGKQRNSVFRFVKS